MKAHLLVYINLEETPLLLPLSDSFAATPSSQFMLLFMHYGLIQSTVCSGQTVLLLSALTLHIHSHQFLWYHVHAF